MSDLGETVELTRSLKEQHQILCEVANVAGDLRLKEQWGPDSEKRLRRLVNEVSEDDREHVRSSLMVLAVYLRGRYGWNAAQLRRFLVEMVGVSV